MTCNRKEQKYNILSTTSGQSQTIRKDGAESHGSYEQSNKIAGLPKDGEIFWKTGFLQAGFFIAWRSAIKKLG